MSDDDENNDGPYTCRYCNGGTWNDGEVCEYCEERNKEEDE